MPRGLPAPARAVAACKALYAPWAHVPAGDIVVKGMEGGLSNVLFSCSVAPTMDSTSTSPAPTTIVARILGEGNAIVDREAEMAMLRLLSGTGIAPGYYGTHEGVRLEEMLPGEPISRGDYFTVPETRSAVARTTAYIHTLDLGSRSDGGRRESLSDGFRVPLTDAGGHAHDVSVAEWGLKLENTLGELYAQAKQASKSIEPEDAYNVDKYWAMHDWERAIQESLDAIRSHGGPIVLCHNDLHEGNWIQTDAGLRLIDYEYAGYNYRGYELGNMINECIYDYAIDPSDPVAVRDGYARKPHDYPMEKHVKAWAREYASYFLSISRHHAEQHSTSDVPGSEPSSSGASTVSDSVLSNADDSRPDTTLVTNVRKADGGPRSFGTPSATAAIESMRHDHVDHQLQVDAIADAVIREARVGSRLSHLLWSLWGIMYLGIPGRPGGFDYSKYALSRGSDYIAMEE